MKVENFSSLMKLNYSFLTLFIGPMFSGKTKHLIMIAKAYLADNQKILAFKPTIDQRFSKTEIVSHDGDRLPAIPVMNFHEIINKITTAKDVSGIFIDEVHFYDPEFSNELEKLLQNYPKLHFYVSGLNKGFSDHNLPIMNLLATQSDFSFKFFTKCFICNQIATKTQAIDENQKPLSPKKFSNGFVGGKEKYQVRCRRCYCVFN